uniref:Uncharacterized protein n=1 Tax=Brassica campestris TaxID=3711 RepID=A0A3P6CS21_BRACM|nr:unnamed protein product [Brassica rapa]
MQLPPPSGLSIGTVSCLDDPGLKVSLLLFGLKEKWRRSTKRQWHAKTLKPERLEEDFKVFDYELRKEHMEVIKSMDRRYRTNRPAKFRGH